MADSTETSERTNGAAAAASRARRSSARPANDDLESQIAQLQSDIKSIAQSITRMGEDKVGEVRGMAKLRASELRNKGEEVIENAQEGFGTFEKQIKDTIRDKPLTAIAGALALGFLIAVITR